MNLGCTPEQVKLGLTSFTGTARRFEIKGSYNNITVVDDYAHHPTEIKATINAAKNSKYNNIWVAFQPHTYTRAKNLHKEFSEAFKECYKVVVADIYAAREKDPGDINSQMLTNEINEVSNNAVYCGELEKVAEYIKNNAQPGDIVISAGAGTINQVCDMLLD